MGMHRDVLWETYDPQMKELQKILHFEIQEVFVGSIADT